MKDDELDVAAKQFSCVINILLEGDVCSGGVAVLGMLSYLLAAIFPSSISMTLCARVCVCVFMQKSINRVYYSMYPMFNITVTSPSEVH